MYLDMKLPAFLNHIWSIFLRFAKTIRRDKYII